MDMLTPPAGTSSSTPATVPRERSDTRAPADTAAQATPTTLKYKFDWLLQRQVSAGTMSADKAAAMIKLFDAATGSAMATPPDRPTAIDASSTNTSTDTGDDRHRRDPDGDPPPAAADRLLDDLRDHFTTTTGPYGDTGAKTPSSPTGIVLDERA